MTPVGHVLMEVVEAARVAAKHPDSAFALARLDDALARLSDDEVFKWEKCRCEHCSADADFDSYCRQCLGVCDR